MIDVAAILLFTNCDN